MLTSYRNKFRGIFTLNEREHELSIPMLPLFDGNVTYFTPTWISFTLRIFSAHAFGTIKRKFLTATLDNMTILLMVIFDNLRIQTHTDELSLARSCRSLWPSHHNPFLLFRVPNGQEIHHTYQN